MNLQNDKEKHKNMDSLINLLELKFSEAQNIFDTMIKQSWDYPGFALASPMQTEYVIITFPERLSNQSPIQEGKDVARRNAGPRSPLIESAVNNKSRTLTVTAEIPGVRKQDIKVKADQDAIIINAHNGTREYRAEVPVKEEFDRESIKASYSNGILELKINLREKSQSKSTDVKVE